MRTLSAGNVMAVFCLAGSLVGCGDKPVDPSAKSANLTLTGYDQVVNGMVLAEVEQIFGTPGSPGVDKFFLTATKGVAVPPKAEWKKWQVTTPTGVTYVGVAFIDGKVVGKTQSGLK